jgi:aryl-alcohol dehydrogenase-like predicted oxidoreductase
MSIDRIELQKGYSISRIIKGGWHLAGGHGSIDERTALKDMRAFVKAGVTTFDCADIYTGVEELIGKFLKQYDDDFASGELPPVQIHTKYVPDYDALATLKKADTVRIIDRSLKRLGVDRLDLVQLGWWSYATPGYIEAAQHLVALQKEGKIRLIGITNFDGAHLKELVDAGIPIAANQVQYSLLDHRPKHDMSELEKPYCVPLLCYGTIAGGFLSDRYLNLPDPAEPLENRSLVKYRLIIEEFGGYELFQRLLTVLRSIADKYGVGISEIAIKYMLQKSQVVGVIVGVRNLNHLTRLKEIDALKLDQEDLEKLTNFINQSLGPNGLVYELERDKKGKHGAIMRYNLNS